MVQEPLDAYDLVRLLIEVVLGIGPERSEFPDSPVVREAREQLKRECDEIESKGLVVDIPNIMF